MPSKENKQINDNDESLTPEPGLVSDPGQNPDQIEQIEETSPENPTPGLPTAPGQVYRYVRTDGRYLSDIPASDIPASVAEAEGYDTVLMVRSGIYALEPAPEPEKGEAR